MATDSIREIIESGEDCGQLKGWFLTASAALPAGGQASTNICQEPDSKYFKFCGHAACVPTTQWSTSQENSRRQ